MIGLNLSLWSAALGKGGADTRWQQNFQRLADAYSTAQSIPDVSPSPPTITTSASTDASLTVDYSLTYNTHLDKRYSGGGKLVNYSSGGLYGASVLIEQNLNAGQYQEVVFHEIETASPVIEFRLFRQNSSRVRIYTRDSAAAPWQKAHSGLITLNTTAGSTFVKVTYPGALAGRQTRLELARYGTSEGTAIILTNIKLATGYSAIKPAIRTAPVKVGVFGDSFIDGANATFRGDGLAPLLGWLMNWEITNSGIGGTGLLATRSGVQLNLIDRLDDALLQDFDAFVIAMGTNDTPFAAQDITAAAATVLSGLKSRNPKAPQFWITPWDLEAPAPLSSGKAAVRDAIKVAVGGRERSGVYVVDMTGVEFTQVSAHPDDAGHLTLANSAAIRFADILAPTNRVKNGAFTTDLANWSNGSTGTGSASWETGGARLQGSDASNRGILDQAIETRIGQRYKITYDATVTLSGLFTNCGTTQGGNNLVNAGVFQGSNEQTFVATTNKTWVRFTTGSSGGNTKIDNVSVLAF